MKNPNKQRLRRTMMFLNAQKPSLIKDPYIYKPDSIMLDLEDAVAENQKDAARFSLYHALKTIDYRGCERVVRINGLDTPYWKEDIRCSVAGGADTIRIPKTESAQDVKMVEWEVEKAEKEFGRPVGSTLIMAALESARGVMRALDICDASERMMGIALSGGDYTKDLMTHITGTGVELMGARQQMIIATSTIWKASARKLRRSTLWALTANPSSTRARSTSSTRSSRRPRRKSSSLRRSSPRSIPRKPRASAYSRLTAR